MVKVYGDAAHRANLRRIAGPQMVEQVGAALFVGGQRVQTEAQLSITRGAVSGKEHIVSNPGEPPKADTHFLADSIETVQVEPLKVEVSSNAPYSTELEYGTSKMQARPFMAPALAAKREEVSNLIQRAVSKVVHGGKVAP